MGRGVELSARVFVEQTQVATERVRFHGEPIALVIAALAGIPLALILVLTAPGSTLESPRVHRVLGALINGFRATPFIILLVALLPFTRLVVGATIGVWAAVVPLSISATPFFARIAEISLREVDRGLVEAAQAMGCERRHIVWHVLLPEALPGIIGGFTLTIVSLIGASAMAGAVGAGGRERHAARARPAARGHPGVGREDPRAGRRVRDARARDG